MLAGHSGDRVVLHDTCVVKRAIGTRAGKLRVACALQRNSTAHAGVRAAQVFATRGSLEEFEFAMERVHGGLLPSTTTRVVVAMQRVMEWIQHNQTRTTCFLDRATVEGKLLTILSRPLPDAAKHHAERVLLDCGAGMHLPGSFCHGDLTLCNALESSDTGDVCLFDFSPQLVNSPAFDVVKLRQDTAHGWIRLFDSTVDPGVLGAADHVVRGAFLGQAWYRQHYSTLQRLSLLRILPYATRADVVQWVLRELEECTP